MDYRNTPIPDVARSVTALQYSEIPFEDNHDLANEPVENAFSYGLSGESFYARRDGLNAPYFVQFENALDAIYLRHSIIDKLLTINALLSEFNLEVYLLDGYRPISLQKNLWDFFMDQGRKLLKTNDEAQLVDYAGHYVSDPRRFDPKDQTTWPIHSTGGSVDLTLKRKDAPELLYMGSVFDDPSDVSHTRYYETIYGHMQRYDAEAAPSIISATTNRRILYHVMCEAGFTNYMYEWWHFDFGNQMWALNKNVEDGSESHKAFYKTATI